VKHRKAFLAIAAAGLLGLMGWQASAVAAVAPLAAQVGKDAAVDNSIVQVQRRGGGRGIGGGGRGIGRGFGGMRRGGGGLRAFRGGGGRGIGGGGFRRGGVGIGRAWGGGRRYGGGRRWRGGRWVAPLIGGALIGAYAYPQYYTYRSVGGGGGRQLCADRFRSFRWSDGTYQPYGDGPRRLCPYLR